MLVSKLLLVSEYFPVLILAIRGAIQQNCCRNSSLTLTTISHLIYYPYLNLILDKSNGRETRLKIKFLWIPVEVKRDPLAINLQNTLLIEIGGQHG